MKREAKKRSETISKSILRKYFQNLPQEEWPRTNVHSHENVIWGQSPGNISVLAVYRILRSNFGRPTYGGSDKEQWEYRLKGINSSLFIRDYKAETWFIGVLDERSPAPKEVIESAIKDSELLVKLLFHEANKLKISSPRRAFGRYLENVFLRTYEIAEHYTELAEEILEKGNDIHAREKEGEDIIKERIEYFKSLEDLPRFTWAATTAFILSLEAFFNMLYEIHLRKELRSNTDLLDHIMKLPLTDRWLLAHTFLTCFDSPLESGSAAFGKLKEMINSRNGLVHSKLSDENRVFYITEDGFDFFTSKSPIWRKNGIEFSEVIAIQKALDSVIKTVLSKMKPATRNAFGNELDEDLIEIDRLGRIKSQRWDPEGRHAKGGLGDIYYGRWA